MKTPSTIRSSTSSLAITVPIERIEFSKNSSVATIPSTESTYIAFLFATLLFITVSAAKED